VRAGKSSQFLSALLLIAPHVRETLEIRLEDAASSRAYIDMTIRVMKGFGVHVERRGDGGFAIPAGQQYRPVEYEVEADASGASYFLAAAAIAGGTVEVRGIALQSMQPDIGFAGLLARMGCIVEETVGGVRVTGPQLVQGIDVDMNGMPDVVPTLAVTSLFAATPSRISNIAHLRYKESDRLAALEEELSRTGARVGIVDDGLAIHPGEMRGAQLDTRGDHRLAMSFALLGLRVAGIAVENPECVTKSFPAFWAEFDALGTTGGNRRDR
jgi:3-phosphoshikimate 1-carboxyvinyltransferase